MITEVTFNNGIKCPAIGLGTWMAESNVVYEATKEAIDAGYRHFDTAFYYGNEKEIGKALMEKMSEGKVKREDLFVTDKLWNTFHHPDHVGKALEKTLENLRLDYVDLYLIHSPMAFKGDVDMANLKSLGPQLYEESVPLIDTWKAMENLVKSGLAKSIGVSNFNSEQIRDILNVATIKPVTNQVECHPYLNQKKLKAFCESRGILITAYGPLGSPQRPWPREEEPNLLQDKTVAEIAGKFGKTPGQILIKYQVQMGNIVIPKSVNKNRIKSNMDVFDFTMSDEDIAKLNSLDRGYRYFEMHWVKDHKNYPFSIDF